MLPSGPNNPMSGAQAAPPSILRAGGGLLAAVQQGSLPPSSQPLSSLSSQFMNNNNAHNMNFLGNMSNVSSLVGGIRSGDQEPLSFASSHQLVGDQMQSQHLNAMQNQQQQLAASQLNQQQLAASQLNQQHAQMRAFGASSAVKFEQQMGLPAGRPVKVEQQAVGHLGPVKLEQQMGPSDQSGMAQHLQSLVNISTGQMDQQQLQSLRNLAAPKLETQQSDSLYLHQQQHQLLQMSRQQASPAAITQMSFLQQQQHRLLQLQQQQQQQQAFKNFPLQQRNQLQQQLQQSMLMRSQPKMRAYEPGTCARRLSLYMCQQQRRPEDNSIEFWRKFVAEFFAPNAKKRWCVSQYGSGRQTTGVPSQDAWQCEICNRKPGRGFETTVEVLPRLYQIKYASGTLEELLYMDMPQEYQNASGQIVLDYAKAVQESVYEQLRVVREGQLRIIFSLDLKICSWEFCARRHEELIPRRALIPHVSQLGTVVQKYQSSSQNPAASSSVQDLRNTCNSFVSSARQMAKTLEAPLVNDLGYTKRYVRCLQISEVVNCMKDLIEYSRETGMGPMESLNNYTSRRGLPAGAGMAHQQQRSCEDQQNVNPCSTNNDQSSHLTSVPVSPINNNGGMGSVNSCSVTNLQSTCSTNTYTGLLNQGSMNSRQEVQMKSVNGPYGGQIPSGSSSNSIPLSQQNASSSPFPSPTLSTSNNAAAAAHNGTNSSSAQQPGNQQYITEPNESQESVHQMLQEVMSMQMESFNGARQVNGGMNCLGSGDGGVGVDYGSMAGAGPSGLGGGLREAMSNNNNAATISTNGAMMDLSQFSQDPTGMSHQHPSHPGMMDYGQQRAFWPARSGNKRHR